MRKRRSFVLIELLIVIAIIGLFASIVLVIIRGVKEKARIAKSMQFSDSIRASLSDCVVSWWSFNEGAGNVAGDVWEGNSGTISGATWTEGVSGSALSFDGNDSVTASGSGLNNISTITVEVWFKTSVDQFKFLFAKSGSAYYDWGPLLGPSNIYFFVKTFDNNIRNVSSPTPIKYCDINGVIL